MSFELSKLVDLVLGGNYSGLRMKVVLLHDWLTGMRGGERVLEAFCELFPDAPLYTLIHKPGSTSSVIENRKITTSFLNKIPGIFEGYRKFLPLFPVAADSIHITEKADLVLSSSHCVIKAVKKPVGSKHISYLHSPMRYIYDQFDSYFGSGAPWLQRNVARAIRGGLTRYDLNSNHNVDRMLANSEFVKNRISKFYNLDADVVNPFVNLEDFPVVDLKKENYFLMVTAFAPNKRVDLAVQAFNKLGLPLKIIGSGQQEKYLKEMASSNIEFLGNLGRQEVVSHLSRAQALIFPGIEDFGITPLEALAAGTPVIAFKAGGVLETLNDSVADFFTEPTVNSLVNTVTKFNSGKFSRDILRARAENYSKVKFKTLIKEKISEVLN